MDIFSREDIQMNNRQMMLNITNFREMKKHSEISPHTH